MTTTEQFCTFHIHGHYFGIEVQRIQEILKPQPMTAVPLAPAAVHGLINLRGQIVAALDLRQLFGFPKRVEGHDSRNVIVRDDESVLSFIVDDIDDVVDLDPTLSERPPENVPEPLRPMLRSVFKLKNRLLLVLELDQVLSLRGASSLYSTNH